jgi:hypothetical protein
MFSHCQKPALGALTAVALALAIGPAHALTFNVVDIVDPANPTFTQALGINDASTIVGYGNATVFNGFELVLPPVAANFTRLNVLGADGGTQVIGISGNGLTTVGFSITGGVTNGFAHTGSTFTTVDQPGTAFNQLLGLNASGTVAAAIPPLTRPVTRSRRHIQSRAVRRSRARSSPTSTRSCRRTSTARRPV